MLLIPQGGMFGVEYDLLNYQGCLDIRSGKDV